MFASFVFLVKWEQQLTFGLLWIVCTAYWGRVIYGYLFLYAETWIICGQNPFNDVVPFWFHRNGVFPKPRYLGGWFVNRCYFSTCISHPHDDTIQKCCESGCWWFYRTPGQSFPFDILIILPLSVFGSAACFHDVFCQTFLANYCGNWNSVTVKLGGSTRRGCQDASLHQDYCIFSGESL